MGPEPNRTGPRKRIRKRKRRAVSSSSSSSSSSESSDSDTHISPQKIKPSPPRDVQETSESETSSDTDSDTSQEFPPAAQDAIVVDQAIKKFPSKRQSLSPSPPPPTIPSFIPPTNGTDNNAHTDQILKDRFRKFWMASVADGFKDDLEEIRKEPNLGTSRLSLLIDSLASGADVFAPSSHRGAVGGINEMEVVLDSSSMQ